MTNTKTAVVGMVLMLGIATVPVAFAKGQPAEVGNKGGVATSSVATSTKGKSDDRPRPEEAATSTSKGQGETNRSAVATQVQALLAIADREGGIGAEVREIARELASSTERVQEAKERVLGRPGWLAVLIGDDYKSLGALRSELVTTENQIERLTTARERATTAEAQAALDAEIAALKETASSTQAFIEENESGFSFLGWFFRLF